MGPYGSVWGDIKTGKRSMAHDHFQTPPDPQKTGGSLKKRFGGSGSNRLIRRTTMNMMKPLTMPAAAAETSSASTRIDAHHCHP